MAGQEGICSSRSCIAAPFLLHTDATPTYAVLLYLLFPSVTRMPAAHVPSSSDSDPLVPVNNSKATVPNGDTQDENGQSTAMDPTITETTLRRKETVLADDEREEMELDTLGNKDNVQAPEDIKPESLRREDLGNFILLVVLCKYTILCARVHVLCI